MLITIGWKAGSGKSTIAKMLVEKLWYERISIGDMKRKIADEMGISIYEFNRLGDIPGNEEKFDKQYEEYQRNLDTQSNILLESRLWFYCQPHAFKIFLDITEEVAATRIMRDTQGATRGLEKFASLEDAMAMVHARNLEDEERYLKLYGIHYFDPKHYDLVVDTGDKTPDQILAIIVQAYTDFTANKTHA